MQNISYLVVVKYLAILAGIYDFLNYSMYYNTSRTLNKSVNEESEIFDAIVTHESSDMYHHDICEKDQFYKYYCVRSIIVTLGRQEPP